MLAWTNGDTVVSGADSVLLANWVKPAVINSAIKASFFISFSQVFLTSMAQAKRPDPPPDW
ncbi:MULTISPECIES: hypothetical protein [Pseudomonas]|uniref:hypothetical protein n=1 Tax=Pseudomonas TaxID=286 RepID=UPI00301DBF0B